MPLYINGRLQPDVSGGGGGGPHAGTHGAGAGDEVQAQNLGSSSTDPSERLRPDGAGGLEFIDEADITDFDGGTDSTSGGTPIAKVSVAIPAEDETFIIEAGALISMSNTTANGEVRLQNQTDATTLGRIHNEEVADSENVVPATFKREYVQTAAAGAKTIALEYYIGSGIGTLTISDAYIRIRRKVS